MGNPFVDMFGQRQAQPMQQNNVSNLGPIKNIMQMYKTAQNPQMLLQSLAQQNPQFAQVLNLVNGKNPQEVFYQMCKARGVNPDDILNQLK